MSSDGVFETQQVARIAHASMKNLDYWSRTGLVTPSVRGSSGNRVPRLWSVADVVAVRAVVALRAEGVSLQKVRKVVRALHDHWREVVGSSVLVVVGDDVLRIGEWGEVVSLLRQPQQNALAVVALPVGDWRAEAEAEVLTLPPRTHGVNIDATSSTKKAAVA